MLAPDAALFAAQPLHPEVAAIAAHAWREGDPPPGGDAARSPCSRRRAGALRWQPTFRDGALRAVNLGGDSDVVAAVYGQLAGAHFGLAAIPRSWRQALVLQEPIAELADRLLQSALVQLGESAASA